MKDAESTQVLRAAQIAIEDREARYGDPLHCLETIAALWNGHLSATGRGDVLALTPEDVAFMMADVKKGRALAGKKETDNYVDFCGYGALAEYVTRKKT